MWVVVHVAGGGRGKRGREGIGRGKQGGVARPDLQLPIPPAGRLFVLWHRALGDTV